MPSVNVLEQWLWQVAIGMARIGPALYLVPCFNEKTLGGAMTRNLVIALLAIGMLPMIELPAWEQPVRVLPLLATEVTVGLLLGVAFATPFWAALAMGDIIDNQRGASIGATLDPTSGVESTLMSTWMTQIWLVYFLLSGGMLLLVQTVAASYEWMPVARPFQYTQTAAFSALTALSIALAKGLMLASPVVMTLFLIEVGLGVLSRFAPQLNAFSTALSVKSLAAFSVMLIYVLPVVPHELATLFDPQRQLPQQLAPVSTPAG